MSKALRGSGVPNAAARRRRVVAFALALAMTSELVPAQAIRAMLPVRGVAEAATGDDATLTAAATGDEIETGGGSSLTSLPMRRTAR